MKKANFTFKYVLGALLFVLGTSSLFSQVTELRWVGGGFLNEAGWEVLNTTTGTIIDCEAGGTAPNAPAARTIPLVDGNTYEIYGYDSFGDGWNGGRMDVVDFITTFDCDGNSTVGDLVRETYTKVGGGNNPACGATVTLAANILTSNLGNTSFAAGQQTCAVQPPPCGTLNMDPAICGITHAVVPAATVININGSVAACPAAFISSPDPILGAGAVTVEFCITDVNLGDLCAETEFAVADLVPPVFDNCPLDMSFNLLPGECDIVVTYAALTVSDNCPLAAPAGMVATIDGPNNGGAAGGMVHFLLTNLSSATIFIDALESNTDNAGELDIYWIQDGDWNGNTGNAAAWTLIGTGTKADPGYAAVTLAAPIAIPAGTHAISIHTRTAGGHNYTNGTGANQSFTDGTLQIDLGSGQNGLFLTNFPFNPRVWNGSISYATPTVCAEPGVIMQTDGTGFTSGDLFEVGVTNQKYEVCDAAGNTAECSFDITVTAFTGATTTLACNDNVQVSLDEDNSDCTLANADILLEGGPYGCYTESYTMTRTPAVSGCGGVQTDPGEILFNCSDIGSSITVRVTDNATGSSCWGTVTVEDKIAPTLECRDLAVDCNETAENAPAPFSFGALQTLDNNSANLAWFFGAAAAPTSASFELTNSGAEDLQVSSFDLGYFNAGDTDFEVYTAPAGSATNNAALWTLSSTHNAVTPAFGALTNIPTDVIVPAGGDIAVIVTALNNSLVFNNVGGTAIEGNLAFGNSGVINGGFGFPAAGFFPSIGVNFADGLPLIEPADNCSIASLDFVSESASGSCAAGTSGTIRKTWTATDPSGNISRCEQIITIIRPTLGDVTFPEGTTSLDCSSDYPDPGVEVCVKDTVASVVGIILPDGPTAETFGGNNPNALVVHTFDIDSEADGSRTIKDLNVAIDFTHGDINEAQIALARLDAGGNVIASSITVLYTADLADGYVQCSNALQTDFNIIFDDEGCVMPHEPCVDFSPSIRGQYIPFQSLSSFDGGLVNAVAGDDFAILYRDLADAFTPGNVTNGVGALNGLEVTYLYQDADVIQTPTIGGGNFATGDICGLTSTYSDERIDVCPTTYKIIRTWTVIDWCSGDKTVTDQLIKVVDSCPPVLDVPNTIEDDRFTWDINVYEPSGTNSGAHNVCMGNAVLPPVDICSENCSGVDATTWTTSLFSADGVTLLGSVNTNGGTFRDLILDLNEGPDDDKAPGLIVLPDLSTPFLFDSIRISVDSETLREPDAIYLAKYKVSDNCGNSTEAEIFIRLLDKIPPVPVVREETQLSLTGGAGDTTALCASDLDEGSYDNCGGTHFFIRKMLSPTDTDPICNLDFGFGPDPTLTFEIFGKDGVGVFDLARDCVYKSCTSFTCADIGTDNQVFVLVVDDYVVNFINDYLDGVFDFIDAIVDYSLVPLTILPGDRFDDEEDIFTFDDTNGDGLLSQDEVQVTADRDRRNAGQRNFEFYLNEDPRADGLFVVPTALVWEGHYNFAMVNVHVEDKVRPECTAPEDVWTTCDKIAGNSDLTDSDVLDGLFGSATVTDNCNATLDERAPTVDVDLCGVGTVTRNWTAEDDFGNRSLGRCRQTIMIMPVNEYEITVPADFEEECDDASPADLTYEEIGCDLLAVSREVEEFPVSAQGECKKMLITWKVINWCEYDGASPAVELPRQNFDGDNLYDSYSYSSDGTNMTASRGNIVLPSTGFYSYIQQVKIFDNTAPDVSYDGDTTFCGGDQDEDPCTGLVEIDPDRSDLCTNTEMTWELDAFSDSFNEADFDGGGALSTRLPLGTHTVRFFVDDECGNTSFLTITFTVVDCKAPTPVCHNGLSIDVMPLSGMVELWAVDFDASSFDYCSPYELRVNIVEDTNNDGVINADDYVTSLPSTDNIILDCADVAAGLTMVQLWVAEQDGDDDDNAADNQDNDYCVTFVEVQDNNGVCSTSPKAAIGGKVANEAGESVEAVTVEINNGSSSLTSSMVTDASGEYDFRNLPLGGDYTVAPMRLDDAANGVSTFDLIKISRHILNVELLDSPYKIIAADANNSNNISTVDLIAVRKVILRVADEFPNNTSWRFVDKGYTFANAAQPLGENFAEVINRNNLDSPDFAANFVAIKVGDVNGDATPNSILGVDGRTFNGNMILNASEQSVAAGEEFTVEFTAAQDVDGYQFTLDYNEKAVELVDVVDGLATEAAHFNVAEGQIATSWNQDVSTKGQVMFSLVFRAKDAIEVSNVMSVNSAITAAEAYGVNGDLMGISLEFDGAEATAQFELAQNTPNPFKTETVIGFTLPEASNATLTVSDVTGKVLRVVTGDFAKGYNQVSMKRADIGVATGVLSYRLEANGNTATKQMIVIE